MPSSNVSVVLVHGAWADGSSWAKVIAPLAASGVKARIAKLPMSAVLRAQATGETEGFMKALVGENDDRILGFTMIGAEAGEVMAVVQTAMMADLPYTRLRDAPLAHPTFAEGLGFLFSNTPPRQT